jgi:putative peptide zinc metalloprotease protein
MVAVVLAALAINVWIFVDGTMFQSVQMVMFRPEMILRLFVLDTIATLFHEFGHAAALRRSGVRYRWIGFALYVIFPVFYTDVTHVYRLNRRERIRVDLGGMYFELVMMVIFFAGYLVTGSGLFLIAIVLTTLSFLQQFTPFLRFDGDYTVADIMGVHEPLSLVKPYLRDLTSWPRGREKSLPNMRRGARIAFTFYLLAIVAFPSYPLMIGAFAGR